MISIVTLYLCQQGNRVSHDILESAAVSYDGLLRLCRRRSHAGRVGLRSPRERYDTVPSSDGSHTVKARFLCTQTHVDRLLYNFLSTAHLAGVPFELVGLGWDAFSMVDRQWFPVDYAEAEDLNDDDVVALFDSDMLFTGEDLYPAVAEFVKNSPASASTTDPLLVRLNKQVAPVLFSAENNCVKQQFNNREECTAEFDDLDSLYANWSKASSLDKQYVSNARGKRNSQRFMNCGFVIGRVWALRLLRTAFTTYVRENLPPDGSGKWTVDQGIFTELFLGLSRWEVTSGLLSEKGEEDRLGKIGPLGMVGGMIGLDYQQKFTAPVHGANVGLLQFGKARLPHDITSTYQKRFPGMRADVINGLRNGTVHYGASPTGAAVMNQSLSFYPLKTNDTIEGDEYWGVPVFDRTTPPVWHFCGPEKKTKLPAFGALLPSLIVLDTFPWEEEVSSRVFWSSEPTRVWSAVPAASRPDMPVTILRNLTADITSEDLCRFS